jgi:hypothetical protein
MKRKCKSMLTERTRKAAHRLADSSPAIQLKHVELFVSHTSGPRSRRANPILAAPHTNLMACAVCVACCISRFNPSISRLYASSELRRCSMGSAEEAASETRARHWRSHNPGLPLSSRHPTLHTCLSPL